ncbi:MAG: hypothetical protein ACXADC_15905 [Candidatus Thorarchaeota archaeon]|jgi:hypothetical protein
MRVKLKIETQWLDLERKSMIRMQERFKSWEQETLQKARDAKDLRSLREVFYELGDRWEWDQTTGAWLSGSEPLDTVGIVIRMPGLQENKERYVVYAVMAYSKGLTNKFDHLGDKERIIIERDIKTGQLSCWSTTSHGAVDIFPVDLTSLSSVENALLSSFLVAQPGDHALRIETPVSNDSFPMLARRLWEIAGGDKRFAVKEIDVLKFEDVEELLDFRFYRYAKAVVELERIWVSLKGNTMARAKELVLDEIPNHIEAKEKKTLRLIEGLLHMLWFRPPKEQISAVRKTYEDFSSEPTPTDVQNELQPYLGELLYSLTDIIEKAKYLKWKSVIEKKEFSESDVFRGLNLSGLAKEALAVALDDILREHTLAYIGYPERATIRNKVMRILFGIAILPFRLALSMVEWLRRITIGKFRTMIRQPNESDSEAETSPEGNPSISEDGN